MNETDQWALWHKVIGKPPVGLHIIVDEQVGEGRAGLRSVAMLYALGCRNFTFVRNWRSEFTPVDYEYVLLRPDSSEDELMRRRQLVQVTTQETERYSPHGFTADLLFTALSAEAPQPLFVLVVDAQDFKLKGTTDGKSLIENYGLRQKGVGIYAYEELFRRYRRLALADSPLSERVTMNPWFHRIAAELQRAGWPHTDRLADLLRFTDRGYPLVPSVMQLLHHFLDDADRVAQLEKDGVEYVRKQLWPWMEAGEIMAVARTIWWGFNVIDYDLKRLLERKDLP